MNPLAIGARTYAKLVSLDELERSPALRWLMGALLVTFLHSFERYLRSDAVTHSRYEAGRHLCPPYFQECGALYVFDALPDGYGQSGAFMVLFTLVVGAGFALYRDQLVAAHACTLIAFSAKAFYLVFLTLLNRGNYDYFHLSLLFVVLFLPNKLAFSRYVFVVLYFLAATVKFHSGWVLGTYFTSFRGGLPIFGDGLAPVMTNAVALMEMIAPWFLLSRNFWLQRSALSFFIVFHLYSGLLVGYMYPITCLPPLLILFAPLELASTPQPWGRGAAPGYAFLAFWITLQLATEAIPGDRKMTLESNDLGLYMFEANHQCVSTETVYSMNGEARTRRRESANARNRCNPYSYLFRLKTACDRDRVSRIRWQFDHSINGDPFYRIIDVPNACELDYRLFTHHSWIRTPEEGAPVVGAPLQNYYR